MSSSLNDDDDDDFFNPSSFEDTYSREELESLTVPQLKQQLRLRGLKVSGKKSELLQRLLATTTTTTQQQSSTLPPPAAVSSETGTTQGFDELMLETETVEPDGAPAIIEPEILDKQPLSKAQQVADLHGKELIDVSEYLDEKDVGKQVKSSIPNQDMTEDEYSGSSSGPEVWGQSARIVEDYEGRSVVVDNLSRCVVEYYGSNKTLCQAFVVASRDALKAFINGGGDFQNVSNAEQTLRELQLKREKATSVPIRAGEEEGLDEGDKEGYYDNVLNRDFSDWGKYSPTGAQLSSSEVQGVLFLSDVYGAFTNDTRALAEKIAFECQPVVVMVPDLFRGKPWQESEEKPGFNEEDQSYEEWRAQHDDLRVSVDIRAAAACLRERYGVSSIAVWGTCYGGGRALEAASGVFPDDNVHDIDGTVGPPPVDPMACIAWYPTRYNLRDVFGANHKGYDTDAQQGQYRSMAVMAIFAGNDVLPGATPADAAKLKAALEEDGRVKDYMVKVFPNQDHGFAHIGLVVPPEETGVDDHERFVDDEFGGSGRVTLDSGEAEVACLLSTAWMETYTRVFLPTTGPLVSKDENDAEWQELQMKDLTESNQRDVRKEIEDAVDAYEFAVSEGKKLDRFDEEDHKELKKSLMEYQKGHDAGEYTITNDDDLITAYEKLRAWDPEFQLF